MARNQKPKDASRCRRERDIDEEKGQARISLHACRNQGIKNGQFGVFVAVDPGKKRKAKREEEETSGGSFVTLLCPIDIFLC